MLLRLGQAGVEEATGCVNAGKTVRSGAAAAESSRAGMYREDARQGSGLATSVPTPQQRRA
eukprot:364756-Chlamydomonas_euryale.AAC.14